jgi:hypothetical protein
VHGNRPGTKPPQGQAAWRGGCAGWVAIGPWSCGLAAVDPITTLFYVFGFLLTFLFFYLSFLAN